MEDQLRLRHPFLIVGIGSVGSKLARDAGAALECACVQLSSDKKDFDALGDSIKIDTAGHVVPTIQILRSTAQASRTAIKARIESHKTVIVVSNLAGTNGPAIAPMVCELAKEAGATVVSIAIMPFGFEKERIFASGVALKRLRDKSDSTIIADNDSFLENNPELSVPECFAILNKSIMHVLNSIKSRALNKDISLLCAGGHSEQESSLEGCVSMLYRNFDAPSAIKRAVIYVENPELSVGSIAKLSSFAEGVFAEVGHPQVELARTVSGVGSQVHMLASGFQKTRFDCYDPLSEIIPPQNVIDWEEPDCVVDAQLSLFSAE